MNSKTTNFIKNFSYTIISNLVTLLVSIIVILVVPKIIGVEDYGYWQVYLFYAAYVGFLHFGWNDGIYLRYGGEDYHSLNKGVFFSQFYMLVILQIMIAGLVVILVNILVIDIKKQFIFQMVSFCMVILNVRYMLLFILQATNRIKEYSTIIILDKILYCLFIIFFIGVGIRDYESFILADLIGKLLALILAIYYCRDIVLQGWSKFTFMVIEMVENIRVGINLMFANIASALIIGVVRFGIERSWDIIVFGKISLVLSVSKFVMVFINAIGVILYPILRRTEEKNLPAIYVLMRNILMPMLLGVLLIFYPLKKLLEHWLPEYSVSFIYMALIFPIIVYEGNTALLINTYLKTLRKEKLMFRINLITLFISLLSTFITTILLKDLKLSILSILILLVFRSILAEVILSKKLEIYIYKDIILEAFVTLIFVLASWFNESIESLLLYFVIYTIYIFIKRNDIRKSLINLNLLMKS